MSEKSSWHADTQETDEFLDRWRQRDPAAFQASQRRLAQRDSRRTFFNLLLRWREGRGLDQTQVAAQMGTSQSAVARLEGGLTDPKLSTLQRYANAVGCELRLSLTPRLDELKVINENDWARAVIDMANAKLEPARHQRRMRAYGLAFKWASGQTPREALGVVRVPGEITISGISSSAEKLSDLIRTVFEHTTKDAIRVEVDLVESH